MCLICNLFSSLSDFWMTVCDDESMLVVASVGADLLLLEFSWILPNGALRGNF